MPQHTRLDVLTRIKKLGLVPIFFNPDLDTARSIVKTCHAAGATVVEFTNRGDRAMDVFRELAVMRDRDMPDLILGVGSIVDASTAAMYIAAGADFIVSAMLDAEVAKLCNTRKIPYAPGCCTPTEFHTAHQLGVEFCKLFPADCLGGVSFLKAMKGPMPWTEVIAMGGIAPTKESLSPWLAAGAAAVGMSTKLFVKELLEAKDYDAIGNIIQNTLALIADLK
ncbi:MAG: beta/alpha barrel domain-containing protein, partial [Planctomycetota bacterium]